MTTVDADQLARSLGDAFAGDLIKSGDDAYDDARALWNGTVDARPALIAQCRTTDDVIAAIGLARTGGRPLSIRGGGHSVAGLSMCDDGIAVDLSHMRGVAVDAGARAATVEPGATWADFDAATARARPRQHRWTDLDHRGRRADARRRHRLAAAQVRARLRQPAVARMSLLRKGMSSARAPLTMPSCSGDSAAAAATSASSCASSSHSTRCRRCSAD